MKKEISFLSAVVLVANSFGVHPFFDNLVNNIFRHSSTHQDLQKQKPLDFRGQRITKEMLEGQDLTDANFDGCIFEEMSLDQKDLTDASLVGADLRNVSLIKTILRGANLTDAILTEKNLREPDFSLALLPYDNVPEPLEFDFSLGTDMFTLDRYFSKETNLSRVNIERADVTETNVGGSELSKILMVPRSFTDEDLLKLYRSYKKNVLPLESGRCLWISILEKYNSYNKKIWSLEIVQRRNIKGNDLEVLCLNDFYSKETIVEEPGLIGTYLEGAKVSKIHIIPEGLLDSIFRGDIPGVSHSEYSVYNNGPLMLSNVEIADVVKIEKEVESGEKYNRSIFDKNEKKIQERKKYILCGNNLEELLIEGEELSDVWDVPQELIKAGILFVHDSIKSDLNADKYLRNKKYLKNKSLSALRQTLYSKGLLSIEEMYPDLSIPNLDHLEY